MSEDIGVRNRRSYDDLYTGRFRGDAWEAVNKARIVTALVGRTGLGPGAAVLDVGFGWGTSLRSLDRLGFRSFGVEITAHAVAVAARHLRQSHLLVGHAETLPVAGDSFDLVVCSHVLEHLPDDRRAADELARVTRPGGWVIIGVPGPGMPDHPLHARNYSLESLAALLPDLQPVALLKRGGGLYKLAGRTGGGGHEGPLPPSRSSWRTLIRPVATRTLGWLAPIDDRLAAGDALPEELWLLARKASR